MYCRRFGKTTLGAHQSRPRLAVCPTSNYWCWTIKKLHSKYIPLVLRTGTDDCIYMGMMIITSFLYAKRSL